MKYYLIRILAVIVAIGYCIFFWMYFNDSLSNRASTTVGGVLTFLAIIVNILERKWRATSDTEESVDSTSKFDSE